ncbi:TetR/AcrR family transcriptional regulator [Janthinobacterium psychrotolerans]|uniref:DNA-binding transcriptional regulator, AcrR family n=1 Tax=Janthinobacterium psychrotolerans TaxID=1747903 RepID=A0A1A7C9J5_9BURK|nr:TetR/AcrR family transcriptional regulator [Janthinobacterium psychrotolerans]OBV40983.1 DNA-binding transcriptional regulator, AcrR family [Janthinobacterium psychrotolerans]
MVPSIAAASHAEPRKRPSQARSIAAVAAMVEAAARIIETRGWAALTTNHVAERAGFSIGSLYQYFPSKEALLAELLRRERAQLLREVRQATETAASLAPAIEQCIAAGLRHQFGRPALALALEYVPASLAMHQEDTVLRQALDRQLAAVLARHGVAGSATLAADLVALCRGMIDAAALRGETDAAALLPRLLRAVRAVLQPVPGPQ